MALIGKPKTESLSLFNRPAPAPKSKGSFRASLRAYMEAPYATRKRSPKKPNWNVEVSAAPNPDYESRDPRGSVAIDRHTILVHSYAEASEACQRFIRNHELGGGNWTGGTIRDVSSGKVVGYVSYNGRVWDRRGAGARELL